jgi:hypothetical protein
MHFFESHSQFDSDENRAQFAMNLLEDFRFLYADTASETREVRAIVLPSNQV